jgi:dihydrofolate reductase
MRIVVLNHVTLDGVMQAPGRADEDTRGGFTHGGWAAANNDEVMAAALGARMGRSEGALLFGRRTYEDLLTRWNDVGGPYADALNAAPKYVASRNPSANLPWPKTTLLHGDVPGAVAELKRQASGDGVIMGSSQLIQSLMPHGLIDEYALMIHPLVLGTGLRLFAERSTSSKLALIDATPTSKGVLLATYQPA